MRKNSAGGKGYGKKGDSVFVINHGVQIEREYNSKVSNPNTPAQVGQRARFKLASQVSAALENVIAIPRQGILSPRNRFVKRNMPFFYGGVDGAQVTYENLQLTLGSNGIPGIHVERITRDQLELHLMEAVNLSVSHVAYCIFRKTDEELLQLAASTVVPVEGANVDATITISDPGGDLVIYAYGYRLKNTRAKAKYDNYRVSNAADMATLIANRRLELSDVVFSSTRGTSIKAGDSNNPAPGPGDVMLYLSKFQSGTIRLEKDDRVISVNAEGAYVCRRGAHIKLSATAANSYDFWGWVNNGESTPFSKESVLEFDIQNMRDIVAYFTYIQQGLE